MLSLELSKIVGTPSDQSWSQVHAFRPEEKEKLDSRGHLLAVLSLSGAGEGVTAVEAGREVISRLHEEYYGEQEQEPLLAIEKAVDKVAKEFRQGTTVEIVAASLVGPALYLAAVGKGRAVLMRGSKLGPLLVGGDQVVSASGYLKEGDVLLLGLGKFFTLVGEEVLRAALEAGTSKEAVEALAPLIHGKEGSGDAAAVVAVATSTKEEVVTKMEAEVEKPEPSEPAAPSGVGLPQVRQVGQSLLGRALSLLSRTGPIYARTREERSRRSLATVALILAVLLGLSIFWGMRGRGRPSAQISAVYDEASQKYEEAAALIELNPARSRTLLSQAKEALEAAKTEAPARDIARIDKLLAEIDAVFKVVAREFRLGQAPLFLDLGFIQEGAEGSDLSFYQGILVVLDSDSDRVYAINTQTKSAEVLAGVDKLGQTREVAVYGNKSFVLGSRGIVEVDNETKETRVVVESDETWGEISDLWGYAGNLYLLDSENSEIWKYNRTDSGFSGRRSWLAPDVNPDLSSAVSMAIDGSIWLLTSEANISKFTRGAFDSFGVAGLDKPFAGPQAIYTDEDSEKLYLLDWKNTRVVVLSKSGEYDSQYVWPGIAGATDLIVDESLGKILLLAESKIYEIEINQ